MDLNQFLVVLRVRWMFIVTTFVVGCLATAAFAFSQAPVYSSTGRIFVSTPSTSTGEAYNGTFFAAQRVASYADLATDPSLLQKVIQRENLSMSRSELASRITSEVVPNTLILQITVEAESAEQAQAIADGEIREVISLVTELERPSGDSSAPAIVARSTGSASFNASPSGPNTLLNLIIGALLSLFAGIAGAVIRDQLDTTVKSREDIEKIAGAAIMAALPLDARVRRSPRSEVDPASPLTEGFRVLRTNLQFADIDSKRQMIVVTSGLPNEGKTLTAVNLAQSIVASGRTVLLIDADMRNPNVAERLGLDNAVGLLSVLIGRVTLDEAIQSHDSGVNVLGTGPLPPNPAEVLETDAMRELLEAVRRDYDTIIIDAAPLLPVADTAPLLRHVDGVLLLARFGQTRRDVLQLTIDRISNIGGRLYGVVLNGTPKRNAGAYGYGYGYGYGYEDLPDIVSSSKAQAASNGGGTRVRGRSEVS